MTNSPINYDIIEEVGVIGEKKGWKKELRKISWNNKPAKYDIRDWSTDDETRMSKGITLSDEEIKALYELLKNKFEN